MTEGEAETKWCPMVRHSTENGPVFNRGVGSDDPLNTKIEPSTDWACNCIASDCAMWQWDLELVNPESQSNGLIKPLYNQSTTDGHCGLSK